MVALDSVVGVLVGVVDDTNEELVDDPKQRRGQIRGDLVGSAVVVEHRGEEPAGCGGVGSRRDVQVDYPAVAVDGPVDVASASGDAEVGLVDEPAVPDVVTARMGGIDHQWGEALDPSVDGDVVDLDATLGQQFFDIAVGQALAQVPANGEQDHLGREPVADERAGV